MISHTCYLVFGKLLDPLSLEDAYARRTFLTNELSRIKAQLADPGRVAIYPIASAYDTWKGNAKRVQSRFTRESEWLDIWIARNEVEVDKMLSEAWGLLCRRRDHGALDTAELSLLSRLDGHFERRARQKESGV